MAPMFGENIGRVLHTRDMGEAKDARGNGFTDTVVGKSRVSLIKAGMGNSTAGDNGLVITEHIGLPNRDAHIAEGDPEIEDLLGSGASSTKFRTVGTSLNSGLFLAVPVNNKTVEQVKYTSDRPASHLVVEKVGINVSGGVNRLAKRFRDVMGDGFGNVAIHSAVPANLGRREVGEVRAGSIVAYGCMSEAE